MTASPPDPQGEGELRARRRIIEAADEARRRLARDLHDGAQQQIVITVINLQRAQQKWDGDAARAKELLDTGLESAQLGLTSLRELVAGIHPPLLATRGLNAAVEDLCTRMPIPCTSELTTRRLDVGVEATIYFFVAEALSNVMKHAQASEVSVAISDADGSLVIEVRDNGVGGAKLVDGGVGLIGLIDRVRALAGTLTVTSPPNQGTLLHALVPIDGQPLL